MNRGTKLPMAMHPKDLAIQDIGRAILQVVHNLKNVNEGAYQEVEFYCVDEDYDVQISVRLVKKKTTKQIQEEMFGK